MENKLRGFLNILIGMAFILIGYLTQTDVLLLAGFGLTQIGIIFLIVDRSKNKVAHDK
jgi:membrane-bound ClpP family serine protease